MKYKKFVLDWGLMLILITILVVPGWRLTVATWLQSGILKTGLLKANPQESKLFLQDSDYQMVLEDADGKLLALDKWKDQVLFINFWASWCAPCLAEMPDINQMYLNVQQVPNIQFLMISTDQNWQKAQELVKKKGYDFPIYRAKSAVPTLLFSKSIPTTFVIAPGGEIKLKQQGMAAYNNQEFLDFIKSLTKPV